MSADVSWRGGFSSTEVEALHAEGFEHPVVPGEAWAEQIRRHSLGWVTARDGEQLLGFVNVAWDGGEHAFVLDTLVAADARRRGVGTAIVAAAVQGARDAGCTWVHVDFEEHLRGFYLEACGFRATAAGLIRL